MKKIIIACLSLSLYFVASAQKLDNTLVSGNFINTPFKDFVEEIEMKSPLRFYYQQERIKDVRITFSGTDVSISQVLNDQLKKAGLQFYIEGNNIYVFPGEANYDRIATLQEYPELKIIQLSPTV